MKEFDNIYCYSFYLLTIFAGKINKKDLDPAFTGVIWMTISMVLNVLSLIIYIGGFRFHESESKIYLESALLCGLVLTTNYYFLIKGNKKKEIVAYFDEKYSDGKQKIGSILFLCSYIIVSFVICIYLAKENRQLISQR